jgi:hypothetical protein
MPSAKVHRFISIKLDRNVCSKIHADHISTLSNTHHRTAARQAARYEVTPGGNALGGSSHGLTSDEIRRQRVAAMRRRPRSVSLPSNGTRAGAYSLCA